jgi:hypothetical protein
MKTIKIKFLLYIFLSGLFLTIFFKFKTVSIYDYKFIANTTGVILKNIAIIGFTYKIFTNKNTKKAWVDLLET